MSGFLKRTIESGNGKNIGRGSTVERNDCVLTVAVMSTSLNWGVAGLEELVNILQLWRRIIQDNYFIKCTERNCKSNSFWFYPWKSLCTNWFTFGHWPEPDKLTVKGPLHNIGIFQRFLRKQILNYERIKQGEPNALFKPKIGSKFTKLHHFENSRNYFKYGVFLISRIKVQIFENNKRYVNNLHSCNGPTWWASFFS